MTIKRFEELECWKEARALAKMVYRTINSDKKLAADLRFSSQFSSAALDQGYLTEGERRAIYHQAEKVASLCSGMIKYLRKSSPSSKKPPR